MDFTRQHQLFITTGFIFRTEKEDRSQLRSDRIT